MIETPAFSDAGTVFVTCSNGGMYYSTSHVQFLYISPTPEFLDTIERYWWAFLLTGIMIMGIMIFIFVRACFQKNPQYSPINEPIFSSSSTNSCIYNNILKIFYYFSLC